MQAPYGDSEQIARVIETFRGKWTVQILCEMRRGAGGPMGPPIMYLSIKWVYRDSSLFRIRGTTRHELITPTKTYTNGCLSPILNRQQSCWQRSSMMPR